jgi:hypothetical protein
MISLGWVHPHQGAILILDVMGTCAGINETRVCMFSDEVVNGHHNNTCHSRLCRGEPTTPAQCTSASPAQAVPRMLRLIHRAEVEQALLNSPAESSCGGVPQFREILFKNLMSLRPPPRRKTQRQKLIWPLQNYLWRPSLKPVGGENGYDPMLGHIYNCHSSLKLLHHIHPGKDKSEHAPPN